jgi:cell division septal protein FtsQ
MRISKKIFIPVLLVLLLAGTGFYLWNDNYFFVVKATRLTMEPAPLHASLRTEIEQRAKSKLKAVEGQNIFSMSLQKLRENILTDVWIESVVIEREIPQEIKVRAKIKDVLFIYIDGKNRILPVTEKGQLLNPIAFAQAPDVPVIRNPAVIKNVETLSKVIALYKAIPREGVLNQRDIAEVDWSPVGGLRVELVHSEDGDVILGASDVRLKIKRVASVLKYLESQKQKWRVIDASFSKKVLVRLRKHS